MSQHSHTSQYKAISRVVFRVLQMAGRKDVERKHMAFEIWVSKRHSRQTLLARSFMIEWMLRTKIWYQQALWRWKYKLLSSAWRGFVIPRHLRRAKIANLNRIMTCYFRLTEVRLLKCVNTWKANSRLITVKINDRVNDQKFQLKRLVKLFDLRNPFEELR